MGLFLYFHCNWWLFFNGFVLHPRKTPTTCTQINPCQAARLRVIYAGSPIRQSWAALQPCNVHVGLVMCAFSGQNSRYPQASRFPWLSRAKPLKYFVFLLWPCASLSPGTPSLGTDKREMSNGKHERQENMCIQLCACRVFIRSATKTLLNKWICFTTFSHRAIFTLEH